MNQQLLKAIKFIIILLITGGILWYLFKNLSIEQIKEALATYDYSWILFSIFLSFFSHFLRAWRWKLLLDSSGNKITLYNSYFAVMIGYLANSLFPRLGEVTRCGIANRTHGISVPYSLGTVVTERIIDLILLLLITAATFLLQFNLLEPHWQAGLASFETIVAEKWWVGLVLIGLAIGLFLYLRKQKKKEQKGLLGKINELIIQGIEGVKSVKKVKNPVGFWAATLGIWLLYFLMLYVITFASPLTKDLGVLAGLSILVVGSFGMAAPTPSGFGAFHAFVAGVLVLYGIKEDDGKIFALVLHTSQYITILVFGSISLILVNVMNKSQKWKEQQAK
ncbi:lysylphosphatidylglycerol synthase transmembrane domain-containing protein [Roseivirga pacifica]|uniref:lysylphosphatidylglycerol synthase transmembrane domain-containing protein n=1 Tax=Roseivirga pacifica TaxID=1267423 RepID=UPI003BABF527